MRTKQGQIRTTRDAHSNLAHIAAFGNIPRPIKYKVWQRKQNVMFPFKVSVTHLLPWMTSVNCQKSVIIITINTEFTGIIRYNFKQKHRSNEKFRLSLLFGSY